jgi:endonuclease/exonuclease/phosphatase family metal-dependent hydrolase
MRNARDERSVIPQPARVACPPADCLRSAAPLEGAAQSMRGSPVRPHRGGDVPARRLSGSIRAAERSRSAGRWTWLLLAGLLASAGGCAAAHPVATSEPVVRDESVRVMTFNIRYGTAPDGEHAWPLRRDLAFRAIREFAPAVLGVQEALRFQLDEIAAELPHYGEIGVGRDDGERAGEYSAILYDTRRLAPLETGTFWLSDTPHVPGSMTWGNRVSRLVTWARFRDHALNATYYVFNTHWDHESQPARERSATLLLDRMRSRTAADDPVLLLGDFNAGLDNPAFRALLADPGMPLHDTFRVAQPQAPESGTYHAFRDDRSGARIDIILASPHWRTRAADIVHLRDGNRYPSDHYPVTAIVQLNRTDTPRR